MKIPCFQWQTKSSDNAPPYFAIPLRSIQCHMLNFGSQKYDYDDKIKFTFHYPHSQLAYKCVIWMKERLILTDESFQAAPTCIGHFDGLFDQLSY